MIFNTAQQRRLYALANGDYLPRLPQTKAVRPQVGSLGNMAQAVTINVRGQAQRQQHGAHGEQHKGDGGEDRKEMVGRGARAVHVPTRP